MFAKNLMTYCLSEKDDLTLDDLEEALTRGAYTPCLSNQGRSRGWVPVRPMGNLAYGLYGFWFIRLAIEEKVIPADAVANEVKKRAAQMLIDNGYKPGRKQLKEIKERVIEEALPNALSRVRYTTAWFHKPSLCFFIDAGTQAKADEVIDHLRHCLDEFPLKAFNTRISPMSSMADWLTAGECPDDFSVDHEVCLKEVDGRATVTYKGLDLDSEEVREHMACGFMPTKLALTYKDRLSFILTEQGDLKRITFLDVVKEEADKSAENADELFDAQAFLMASELGILMKAIEGAFGGPAQE